MPINMFFKGERVVKLDFILWCDCRFWLIKVIAKMEYILTFVYLTAQQILIKKLAFYPINTRHIKWIKNGLTCQQRSCQRRLTVGEWFFFEGVWMLLNIFTNDLEVNIKTADNIGKCWRGLGVAQKCSQYGCKEAFEWKNRQAEHTHRNLERNASQRDFSILTEQPQIILPIWCFVAFVCYFRRDWCNPWLCHSEEWSRDEIFNFCMLHLLMLK